MFGQASPFGKPTSSAFGPESAFGQANNANNCPFVAKPIGDTTPFGSPTGGFAFEGTSTGVFGSGFTRTPSLLDLPLVILLVVILLLVRILPWDRLVPLPLKQVIRHRLHMGAAFMVLRRHLAHEVNQRMEPGFGSSNPAFGATSTPAFITDSVPLFGAAGTPAFGSTIKAAFGKTEAPIFGSGGAFGATCLSSLSSGSSPGFGTSNTAFRNNQFGSKSHGAHIGSQVATPTYCRTEFGRSPLGGSRVAPFSPTTDTDSGAHPHGKLQSICGMNVPVYQYKSHEELRWEDYQWGDKGGLNQAGQFGGSVGPGASPAIPWPTFSYSPPGQNPALGLFGSIPAQTSHPSQPTYGSNIYGSSTPFGTQSQSVFSANSTPGFGSSTPAFGATSTPTFITDSVPLFGATGTPAFGSTIKAAIGKTEAPIFVFGGAFGATCGSSLNSGSSPGFGPSKTAFRNNQLGSKSHGAHIGSQVATPTYCKTEFGRSSFGGSRVAPFSPTTDTDSRAHSNGMLQSICAMSVPVYQYKSHEELRWEDHLRGDKGGPNQAGQSGGSVGLGASPAVPWPTFSQSSLFSSITAFNAFSSAPSSATTSNQFCSTSSSNELLMTAPNPSVPSPSSNAGFWPSLNTTPFGCSSSLSSVVRSPLSAFEISALPFISSSLVSATLGSSPSVINVPTTRSSPLSFSTTPSIAKSNSAFKQTPSSFSQTTAPFGQNISPTFGQIHTSYIASGGTGGNLFQSTPSPVLSTNAAAISQIKTSFSLPLQTSEAAGTSGFCSLGNLGQTQSAGTGGFGLQNAFGQSHSGQPSINGSPSVLQLAPAVQLCTGTGSPVQYAISSMPVADKPSPVQKSPLLSARLLSLRQTRLPAKIYHPERGVRRVPFFDDEDNTPSKAEANALFIPRGNPRSLFIGPEDWPAREQKPSRLKKTSPCANDGVPKTYFGKASQKIKGVYDDSSLQNDVEYVITEGAGESAIGYDCGAGIEALMPKLCQPDYYTEPHVKELAAKERAQPGFCCRVKDFVIGRLGYGHIKFVRETDVRRLDIESLIRFNNREVIVYTDDSKKPPTGQGLNKPAEVTLLNVKCIDKKTGKQYVEGPKVQKYKEMLKKAAEEQGAEFVSYDPMKGEWKFKVRHFS